MHSWGDEWFQKYGDQLYDAIRWISNELWKNGVPMHIKEKWGLLTTEYEYAVFWDGGLYHLIHPGRLYIGSNHHGWPYANLSGLFYKKKNKLCRELKRYDIEWPTNKLAIATWAFLRKQSKRKTLVYVILDWLDRFIYRIDTKFVIRLMPNWIIEKENARRADVINRVFQEACKKWPDIVDELISDMMLYKCVVPGKYGDVDGVTIHNKHWKH